MDRGEGFREGDKKCCPSLGIMEQKRAAQAPKPEGTKGRKEGGRDKKNPKLLPKNEDSDAKKVLRLAPFVDGRSPRPRRCSGSGSSCTVVGRLGEALLSVFCL